MSDTDAPTSDNESGEGEARLLLELRVPIEAGKALVKQVRAKEPITLEAGWVQDTCVSPAVFMWLDRRGILTHNSQVSPGDTLMVYQVMSKIIVDEEMSGGIDVSVISGSNLGQRLHEFFSSHQAASEDRQAEAATPAETTEPANH